MLSDELLTDYSYIVSARFEAINTHYIELMGKQIREIGQLSPSNLHRLEQMARMSQNVDEINKLLASASQKTVEELQQVYRLSGMSVYRDASKYYLAKGVNQLPFNQNDTIQRYLAALDQRTNGTFENISNTTVIKQDYQRMVDTAIEAVNTGVGDYNSLIRMQFGDIVNAGIRVEYASGITRRLDSAVRMNVLEGIRQTNNAVRMITGEEFGADGVEISAHALCAADHIDIQGQQYALGDKDVMVDGVLYESFEQLNASLDRPISTLNCKHITFPIILGISTPAYSDEELQSFKDNSQEMIDIDMGVDGDGNPITKQITKYAATQLMRKYETAMRYAKDDHIAGKAIDDKEMVAKAKKKLDRLQEQYENLCASAKLSPKPERAYVPGYKGKQTMPKPITLSYKKPEIVQTTPTKFIRVDFTPSKNIKEAESFIAKFIDVNSFGSVGVSYTGVGIDLANVINNTIANFYENFNAKKLGGISAPKKNSQLGKILNAHAGYSPIRNSLLLNRDNSKNIKSFMDGLNKDKFYVDDFLINPDKYNIDKLSDRVKNVLVAAEKSGRAVVAESVEDTINHELGHLLHHSMNKEQLQIAEKSFKSYADNISGYSTENISEFVAESFTSYLKNENKIDADMFKLFESFRR